MELSPFGDTLKTDFKPAEVQPVLTNNETAEFNKQLMSAIEHLAANFVMQVSSVQIPKKGSEASVDGGSITVDISSLLKEISQSGVAPDGKISESGMKFLNDEFKQLIEQAKIGDPTQYQQLLKDFQDGLQKDLDLFKNANSSGNLPKMFEDIEMSGKTDENLSKQLISDKLNQLLSNESVSEIPTNGKIASFIADLPVDLQSLKDILKKDIISNSETNFSKSNLKNKNNDNILIDADMPSDLVTFRKKLSDMEVPSDLLSLTEFVKKDKLTTKELIENVLNIRDEGNISNKNNEQFVGYKIEDLTKFNQDLKDLNLDEIKLSIETKPVFNVPRVQSLKLASFLSEQIESQMNLNSNEQVGENVASATDSSISSTEAGDLLSFIQNKSNGGNSNDSGTLTDNESKKFFNSKETKLKFNLAKSDTEINTLSSKIDNGMNNNQQSVSNEKNTPLTKSEFISMLKTNSANNLNIKIQDGESTKSMNYNNVLAREIPEVAMKLIQNIQQNESTTARISLMPKSLGTLFVDIHLVDNRIRIEFKADKKESVEAIENQIGILKEKLANSGLTIDKVEVKQNTEYSNNFSGFTQNGNDKKEQHQTLNDYIKTFKNTDNNDNNIENEIENKLSNSHGRLIEKYV